MRPAWVLGWTATATAVLVLAIAVSTLLNFLVPGGRVLLVLFAAPAPTLVFVADSWLRSASQTGIALATAGTLFLGVFAPMCAVDWALSVEGDRTMATVSTMYVTTSQHGNKYYTAELTDGRGRPIERSLADSGPWRVGDQFEVVFDPHGLVPTERPMTVARPWPLPATLASALTAIAGLALMGRRREV
jgi:hypothetical protein